MPKEYLDCVEALKAEGKSEDEAQRICAIEYHKKHGMTPQEAEARMHAEKFAELAEVEIFEAGTYRGKTYTEDDLDVMVKNFDELKDQIKPVAVIGHDEDQELLKKSGLPSAGWMTSVRRVGSKLIAAFKDVPKVLAEIIGKGAYKRISAEIYNDYHGKGLALRRVAILGGEIPEVKTLQDIAALYGDSPEGATTWVTLNEAAPKSNGKENPMDEKEVKKLQEELAALTERTKALEEENKALKAAPKAPQDMNVQELAEQVVVLTETMGKLKESDEAKTARIAELEKNNQDAVIRLSEAGRKARKDDIQRFILDRMKEGRISPALTRLGLDSFMMNLDDTAVVRFGEGARAKDLTPLGFMKELFMAIPRNTLVRFGEVGANANGASRDNDGKTAAEQLTEATKKLMAADKALSFAEALDKAQKENPELAKEYAAELSGQ